MTARLCKYLCGTLLEGFDEQARKYIEAGTGGLHTKERCQEAKAKLEAKNDHGKELVQGYEDPKILTEIQQRRAEYVDHTTKPRLKIKTFTNPTPEGLDLQVNTFGETHNIKHGQYQMAGALYSTQVWYEETLKQ